MFQKYVCSVFSGWNCASFQHTLALRQMGNIVFEGQHERAVEKPAELVGDLRKMYVKRGSCSGVVTSKKEGYDTG